jgi:DNA adenine methylase
MHNRDRFNKLIYEGKSDSAEAAALFYYLNRTAFNGLCRFNSRGFFNVPFGRYKTIPYIHDFSEYAAALQNYELTDGDFTSLKLHPQDFVYADPPYDVEFTSYSAGGFSWDDQKRLAHWLADHKGPVVASNQATVRILELYRSLRFTIQLLDAPRRISCDGNRDAAREMFATRNI